jgi:hypothetical protein
VRFFSFKGVIFEKEKMLNVLKTIALAAILAMISLVASLWVYGLCSFSKKADAPD